MKKSKVEQPCPPPSASSSLYLCLPPQMSRETPIALSHSGTPVMETRSKCSSCTHSLDSSSLQAPPPPPLSASMHTLTHPSPYYSAPRTSCCGHCFLVKFLSLARCLSPPPHCQPPQPAFLSTTSPSPSEKMTAGLGLLDHHISERTRRAEFMLADPHWGQKKLPKKTRKDRAKSAPTRSLWSRSPMQNSAHSLVRSGPSKPSSTPTTRGRPRATSQAR